jgi:hypothetical protein
MKSALFSFAAFCMVAPAVAGFENGSFETVDAAGMPVAWRTSGDVKVVKGAGFDNGIAVALCGKGKKARVTQDVAVEPGRIYELSADVKVSGGEA